MTQHQIGEIDISELRFDPLNPRLPKRVDGADVDAVLKWMLEDATILELMGSIGAKGFFAGEPMLVAPSAEPGCFDVIEGNRRLAAVLLLNDPESAPTKKRAVAATVADAVEVPDAVACVKFDDRDEILDYLGYRHITGIKQWSPLAKARYLHQLWEEHDHLDEDDRLKLIARMIGSKADYVGRLLTALALFEIMEDDNFFDLEGVDEESVDFSFLVVALNRTRIVDYLGLESGQDFSLDGLDIDEFKWLAKWIFEEGADGRTVLGESRNFKELAEIVSKPAATAALKSGESLKVAVQLTEYPTEVFRNSLSEAVVRLTTASNYLAKAEGLDDDDVAMTGKVVALAKSTRTAVLEKVEEEL